MMPVQEILSAQNSIQVLDFQFRGSVMVWRGGIHGKL